MCDLVARTGRHQQRYQDGYRLIAGTPCYFKFHWLELIWTLLLFFILTMILCVSYYTEIVLVCDLGI
ncbi:hypothetical protein DsansV1_C06g0063521 [Dioscorea sansibarensis]